jgi:hypothetical protein
LGNTFLADISKKTSDKSDTNVLLYIIPKKLFTFRVFLNSRQEEDNPRMIDGERYRAGRQAELTPRGHNSLEHCCETILESHGGRIMGFGAHELSFGSSRPILKFSTNFL